MKWPWEGADPTQISELRLKVCRRIQFWGDAFIRKLMSKDEKMFCQFGILNKKNHLDWNLHGSGWSVGFAAEIPAHSPLWNVIGAVTATGLSLPLRFLEENFNQVVNKD